MALPHPAKRACWFPAVSQAQPRRVGGDTSVTQKRPPHPIWVRGPFLLPIHVGSAAGGAFSAARYVDPFAARSSQIGQWPLRRAVFHRRLPRACIVSAARCSAGSRVGWVQRTLRRTSRHFLLSPAGCGLQGGRRGSRTPGPRLRDLLLSRQFRTPSAGAFREADSTGVEPVGRVATPCCFQGSSPRRLGVLSMADTVGLGPTHGFCRVRISDPLHYRSATCP